MPRGRIRNALSDDELLLPPASAARRASRTTRTSRIASHRLRPRPQCVPESVCASSTSMPSSCCPHGARPAAGLHAARRSSR